VIETFRYAFLGSGTFSLPHLLYSFFISTIILFLGLIIFNKVEKNFTDTI